MGFEKFGIVSHTKESKAEDFVEYLAAGKVMAVKCSKCKKNYFPPQVDCGGCLDSNMEWFEVTGSGKLITFSTVQYGPVGFEDLTPYTLGVSEFSGGMKILAIMSKDINEDDIKINMPLKVVPAEFPDGRIYYEFQTAA